MSKAAKKVIFESVGEFLADAKKGDHPDFRSEGDQSFYGTRTFEEAVALAEGGWAEGRERLESLRAQLESTVRKALDAKAAVLRYDVTGDFIDVGRHLTGEPECWGSDFDDEGGRARSKVVKVVANVSALAAVEQRQIFSVGAAIYAAVDLIESLGTRVELWLGSGSEHFTRGDRLNVYVKIKDADQPFEGDRLAFYLAHAGSLRRLFFSTECQRGFAPSQSSTAPLDREEGTVVTAEARPSDNTQAARIARVIETCEACGIHFTSEELAEITG